MPTVVKAQTPADMLALLPHLTGMELNNSIVFATFIGDRSHAAMRFDLPPSAVSDGPKGALINKRLASTAIGTLCKVPGIDAILVAIFTDENIGDDGIAPRAKLAEALGRRVITAGFELRGTLCQASTGWSDYLYDVPPGGFPLSDILDSPVNGAVPATSVDRLRGPLPARIPDTDAATRDRVRAEVARLTAAYHRFDAANDTASAASTASTDAGREAHTIVPAELTPLADIPLFMEGVMDWDTNEFEANDAMLLLMVQGPPIRDLAMLQWATDLHIGDAIFDEAEHWTGDPTECDPYLAGLMLGKGPRPDVDRVYRAIAILEKLIARADDSFRPAPLCMLAWLTWALGSSSRAHVYIAEAQRIDPDYGMAELIGEMLDRGMLPEWAFENPSDRQARPRSQSREFNLARIRAHRLLRQARESDYFDTGEWDGDQH